MSDYFDENNAGSFSLCRSLVLKSPEEFHNFSQGLSRFFLRLHARFHKFSPKLAFKILKQKSYLGTSKNEP